MVTSVSGYSVEVEQLATIIKTTLAAEGGYDSGREERINAVKSSIASYQPNLLTALHETITTNPTSAFSRELLWLLSNPSREEASVHEYLVFRPYLPENLAHGNAVGLIRGFPQYQQLPRSDNYATEDATVQAQVIALITVAAAIEDQYRYMEGVPYPISDETGVTMISDDDLIKTVIANADKANIIVQTIIDRKTFDLDTIRQVIGAESPTLSRGVI